MNRCSVCHSQTVCQPVTYIQWYERKLVLVENVPAEVCSNCGEQYFSPEVADKVQRAITSQISSKTLSVPVFSLSE